MAKPLRGASGAALSLIGVCTLLIAPAAGLDNFRCYKATDRTEPKFAGTTVTLSDQYGVNDGSFSVNKPAYFCNSTEVNGSGVSAPNDHLTCYKIKGPKLPKEDRPVLQTSDALGTLKLEITKPKLLCVPSETAQSAARAACAFDTGAMPEDTLDPGTPRGDQIPIDHLILVMQENRSFDHYFGSLPDAGHTQVDGRPPNASNPDAMNTPVLAFHSNQYCIEDVAHGWDASHMQYDGGLNDGFVVTNDPGGERAMGYLDQTDLPFYYGLAQTFAIGDRYFCSVLGPTYPNRFYYLSATSDGRISNQLVAYTRASIFNRLADAGISFKVYASDLAFALLLGQPQHPMSEFFTDAAAGMLPQVAYVDPSFFGETENDEHPPSNPQLGQQFMQSVYNAVVSSPNWPRSAMVITYDEHGGFYDHVPPPPACIPDNVPPALGPNNVPAAFDRYGFRVPFMVVSPWSRPGYVSHQVFDHTSILRFVETRFNLPALTARDANATPIIDLFDFSQPQMLNPPPLPPAVVDPVQEQMCMNP